MEFVPYTQRWIEDATETAKAISLSPYFFCRLTQRAVNTLSLYGLDHMPIPMPAMLITITIPAIPDWH